MSPLPCSPVSYSTASGSNSHPTTSESEVSDASLTTPRPGPSDPALRTRENLSQPSVPAFSSSPESARAIVRPVGTPAGKGREGAGEDERAGKTAKESKHSESSSPVRRDVGAASGLQDAPGRRKSIAFSTGTASPKRVSLYVGPASMSRSTPDLSPRAGVRDRVGDDGDVAESSADEYTAIFRREGSTGRGYGAVLPGDDSELRGEGYDGAAEEQEGSRKRRLGGGARAREGEAGSAGRGARGDEASGEQDATPEDGGWWKRMVERYGSVELENKGSVARDHLALERTFLAWLRTSLSFASIGIAVTQLFRLNTSLADTDSGGSTSPSASLRQVGKPLGATFLGISILILLLGFQRYFESQHYVIRGKFPASRATIVLVSAVAGALIVASLAVVLSVAQKAFET